MGPRVSMLCILQQSFVMGRIAYVDKARIHPQWPRKPCMLSWRDVRHGGGVLMDESRKEGKGVGMRNRHHVREDLPTASCLCRGHTTNPSDIGTCIEDKYMCTFSYFALF
jgi:hypothetical protein